MGITGRTAVVTGAAGATGRRTTRLLLEQGAQVVVVDRDEDDLAAAVDRLPETLARPLSVVCDLSSDEAAHELARTVAELAGEVDILVHGASTTGATGPFEEIADEDWVEVLTVDLLSAVRVTRAFLPALRQGGWGRVVLVDREDAVRPADDGLPHGAARAGLLSFARGLARSYADDGLRVGSLSPALIEEPRASFAEALASSLAGEGTFQEACY